LDVAQFFYVSGRTMLGLEPAANAVVAAKQLADLPLLRKALTFQGILLGDTGNLPAAIEAYADALDIAIALEDVLAEGSVWNNLGVALLYGAQHSEAIQCFQQVIALAETEPRLLSIRTQALTNIALASLHIEDYARGLESAKASIDDRREPTTANELLGRVLSETTYSRLLLEVDSLEAARTRCEIAKRYAVQSCSQRAELSAAVAEGLYEVYAGKVDIGLSRLQGALEQARIMKAALRDALIALVKAYDMCGKPQLALIHLRELLHHTKKTQQEKALMHHKLHLQRLGERDLFGEEERQGAPLDREKVRSQLALLHRQAIAAELVEDPTGEHIYRVGKLAGLFAAEIGWEEDDCFLLEMSARLHDIGKLGIPDAIMAKRGAINPEQRQLVRTHTNIGAELLMQSGLSHVQMAVDIARHHHERWDGSGYPDGIAGSAIPEPARITTLCDVFDVLTHQRPYKDSWSVGRALSEIRRLKGTKFDPDLTDKFVDFLERLQAEHPDLDEFLGTEARESPFIQARRKIAAALESARGMSNGRPRTLGGGPDGKAH
jgi:HD-GYP domain-containing protein (c-di-GMP phosphodiesterase class II)